METMKTGVTLDRTDITRDYLINLVGSTIFSVLYIKKTNSAVRFMKCIQGAKKFATSTKKRSEYAKTSDIRNNNLKVTEIHPDTDEPITSQPRTIAIDNILEIHARGLTLKREYLGDNFIQVTQGK